MWVFKLDAGLTLGMGSRCFVFSIMVEQISMVKVDYIRGEERLG